MDGAPLHSFRSCPFPGSSVSLVCSSAILALRLRSQRHELLPPPGARQDYSLLLPSRCDTTCFVLCGEEVSYPSDFASGEGLIVPGTGSGVRPVRTLAATLD